jgi:SAM-dependent methyltransferase
MPLWPRPPDESAALDLDAITREVEAFARGPLLSWEVGYLEYHRRRYQDTLRLLPDGQGRKLLDVGSFPGHLSALAQARGWEVAGLNNDIEGAAPWATFLDRCAARKIEILSCDVEREPFPLPTASVDAALFCELFEHLYWNPFHTLREIFRVLRPGGLLVLTTPNQRRVETLFRFLHGWGPQPPVSRPFHALFPSLLYHRHNREYTAREIAYFLARQGKDLYDFEPDAVYYADCLDADHEIPTVTGRGAGWIEQRLGRVLRWAIPGVRGQLMARARRSAADWIEWSALGGLEGFGPLEEDERPVQGFTRRLTFPFRRTGPRAALDVPLPRGTGPVLVSLMVAHLDEGASPVWTRWTVDGYVAMTLELRPGPRPLRVRILVPAALAARERVRIAVEASSGSAAETAILVGGQALLVERLPTPAAIDAALARAAAERRAEEDTWEGWWLAAESLYVPYRAIPGAVEMGPGDETQLGPGWYHREDWGPPGTMRWTGPEAVAYVGSSGVATRLSVRAFAGPAPLGSVSGQLLAAYAAPEAPFEAVASVPFALAPETWADLDVPVRAAPGRVRLTIRVDAPRVPRGLLPGSQDVRALGLAVRRIWLA